MDTEKNRSLEERYPELASIAGGLAHEIKNPLSVLNLNLQLLAEDFRDAAADKERRALFKIEKLQQVVQQLESLLNDFLRFARVTGLKLEPVDINAMLQELIDFYLPQAEQAGIVMRDDLPADLPKVALDRDLVKQAILNLLLNAQYAMPKGGELILKTRAEGDRVVIEITDTGVGMSAETRAKIFQPFFSTRSAGSGLGLPTAKRIVEAHRGELLVQSEPGKGTVFTLKFPVAPSAASG